MNKESQNKNLPRHVAIIMDGNGRWAKSRFMPRSFGHANGSKTFREIASYAAKTGISHTTFYVLSTENLSRPSDEVQGLFKLFEDFFSKEIDLLMKESVKINFIGETSILPERIRSLVEDVKIMCEDKEGMTLNLAMNYGSRTEITRAAKAFAAEVKTGSAQPQDLNEDTFSSYMYTAGQPDVDLLIRTGGDFRISNFLLWQIPYAELVFIKKFWPDFTVKDFDAALSQFGKRERRFGRV